MTQNRVVRKLSAVIAAVVIGMSPLAPAGAQDVMHEKDSHEALKSLYASSPSAQSLGQGAKGILVFPNVTRAGFIVGAQGGDGVLLVNGKTVGHYNTSALSIGLQAGAQSYAYVMFFMSDKALKDFQSSSNFQIGVGPTVVVIDAGAGKDLTTLTGQADVYAMIFDQKGLMAGVGLQGAKITKLK